MTADARRRRRDIGAKPNHERWMIPHLDMITLLLCVFIVLFAQSVQNVSKVKAMAAAMLHAFGGTGPALVAGAAASRGIMNHQPAPIPKPLESPHTAPRRQTTVAPVPGHGSQPRQIINQLMQKDIEAQILAIQKLRRDLTKMLQPQMDKGEVSLLAKSLSLRIRLNAQILFPTGRAALTPDAQTLLTTIAQVLSAIPPGYEITVQGYTDDKPISTSRFSSNWALSAARAVSVVLLFRQNKVPGEELSAQGFSKYRQVSPNVTPAGRSANRRVEIYIEAPNARRSHG